MVLLEIFKLFVYVKYWRKALSFEVAYVILYRTYRKYRKTFINIDLPKM